MLLIKLKEFMLLKTKRRSKFFKTKHSISGSWLPYWALFKSQFWSLICTWSWCLNWLFWSMIFRPHLFLVPPCLSCVESLCNSQLSSLLFFLGLPGNILFGGGRTSISEFISQTLGPLTGYISGIYVSLYVDVKNQWGICCSILISRNLIIVSEWQQGILVIVHFLHVHSNLSRFTTNLSPIMDTWLTSNNFSPAQLPKENITVKI